jgi:hypothetical protein
MGFDKNNMTFQKFVVIIMLFLHWMKVVFVLKIVIKLWNYKHLKNASFMSFITNWLSNIYFNG